MPAPLRLDFEAVPENVALARREVVAFAERSGVADLAAVALAISEAVTNAVVHAYRGREAGRVCVGAEHPPDDGLVVTVEDQGGGFAPRQDSPGLGLGLMVVAQLAQRFEVASSAGGGTLLRMQFE